MTKVSFWWKHFLYLIEDSSIPKFESRIFRSLSRKQLRKIFPWFIGLTVLMIMLLWNWKLVLATAAGVLLMLLVYLMQGWDWQVHWLTWRRYFTGSNRKLTVAVGSGGIAALMTYMAASIWIDSENRWLAAGTIFQGFGTLMTLVLLLWHIMTHQGHQEETKFDRLLSDLTAVDPLKRIIAVRQLTKLVNHSRLNSGYRHQLIGYFRLMLSVEQEPMIREAVLESLQMWNVNQSKTQISQPLQIPVNLKRERLLKFQEE